METHMIRKSTGSRKLRFQALESRQMMAGDVAAYFPTPGDLAFIGGTSANDSLVLSATSRRCQLTGLNCTTSNGAAAIHFKTISNYLTIDLGDGSDSL